MPSKKLTQLTVDRIEIPKAGRVETWDKLLPGFGLRVTSEGHKSWVVMYRMPGVRDDKGRLKPFRYTIGTIKQYPEVEVARKLARQVIHDARTGKDPGAQKKAAKVVAAAGESKTTVRAVATRFVEDYCKANEHRSWPSTERNLRNHVVSRWGDREMASITEDDVDRLLADVRNAGPTASNRVLATVRTMFRWATQRPQRVIEKSPVEGAKPLGVEKERDRVLTDDELVRVWRAAETAGGTSGAFVRMLILLAQRRDETAKMRWADVDLVNAVWTLPAKSTKSGRPHRVPLPAPAVELLSSLPRLGEGEFVFTTDGKHPISGYSKIKERIEALAKIERIDRKGEKQNDWRFHDLRRTAATGMGDLGVAGSLISKILNHVEGGITKVYNRSEQLPERRHALEAWARRVQTLTSPAPDNVVEIRGAERVVA